MDKSSLKYSPAYPGKISEFYRVSPFIYDAIFLCAHILFLRYFKLFNTALNSMFASKLQAVVGKDKFVKIFADGRSSLLFILASLKLPRGTEVLLNPNTCSVVCDAIIAAELVPKFISTNECGSGDFSSVFASLSDNTRAIILTNTYGIIEDYRSYSKLAKERGLVLINDLAQTNIFDEAARGAITDSDISILSFGPEKYLGALGGGALITNKSLNEAKIIEETTYSDVLRVIILRFKYSFTFLCYRFRLLRPFLKFRFLTFNFLNYKDIENVANEKITIRSMHQVVKLSVLLRFWLSSLTCKKEKKNFSILKSLLYDQVLSSPSFPQSTPLYAVLKLKSKDRNHFVKYIASAGFQTLWNYVPLYAFPPYQQYAVSKKTEAWKDVVQIPYRFLSTNRVRLLSDLIYRYYDNRNFFDSEDWLEVVGKVFNLQKVACLNHRDGLVKMINAQSDEKSLYINFMGYFDPRISNINEEKVLCLIDSMERESGKKVIRMKLFPEIKFKKSSSIFKICETEVLDIRNPSSFSKDLRYEINKAIRANVQVRPLVKGDIANFYQIYMDTVDRVESNYITPIDLFYSIIGLPGCFILGAFIDNKIVGGSVYLVSAKYAYYWWNATNAEGRKFSVNYLITSSAIELLREKSIKYLDFASSNNQKILDAKRKWGTKKVAYYEYCAK